MSKKLGKKGQVLRSQSRQIIANVMKFMKEENELKSFTIPVKNYRERVIAATGISSSCYDRIAREAKDIEDGLSTGFTTPRRRSNCSSPQSDCYSEDEFAAVYIKEEVECTLGEEDVYT